MGKTKVKAVATLVPRLDIFPGAVVFAPPDAEGISKAVLRDLEKKGAVTAPAGERTGRKIVRSRSGSSASSHRS